MLCRKYINGSLAEDMCSLEVIADDTDIPFEVIFANQKKRGIHKGRFTDDKWELHNGYDSATIDFTKVTGIPPDHQKGAYIKLLKKYATGLIDRRHILTVAAQMKLLIRVGNKTDGFIRPYDEAVSLEEKDQCASFLEMISVDASGILDDQIVDDIVSSTPRDLAGDFWTYYVFDHELKAFWKDADDEEKIVYGPLYLYWMLCSILPSRPKGFCLMPRDCITKDDKNRTYINVRQSAIKGSERPVTNTIDLDYPVRRYRIDEELASTFLDFRKLMENFYGDYTADRLFCNRGFNTITKRNLQDSFLSCHLDSLKSSFYVDILQKKGYRFREFVNANEHISYTDRKWITDWKLGDLRHLAMIDMIVRGISPSVIMELAGHDSITSACHYYNNSINMNKSRLRFLEQTKASVMPETTDLDRSVTSGKIPVIGGYCHCDEPTDTKAGICAGYFSCQDPCRYFEPSSDSRERIRNRMQQNVEKAVEQLISFTDKKNIIAAEDEIRKIQDEIKKQERMGIWEQDRNTPMNS